MTLKGGTSQACARCKYQRRKCTSECPLAPYFPPDQPKIFQNAHRLFGVSNILKSIKDLDQNQKTEAMRSIIFQSNMRERFPVHGCFGIIMQYQYEIRQLEQELHVTHAQLAFYRQQQQEMSTTPDEMSQKLQLGMTPTPNALTLFHDETIQPCDPVTAIALPISSHPSYSYNANASNYISPACYIDFKDENVVNSFWLQQPCSSDYNQIAIQTRSMVSQPLTTQGVVQDYDLLDTIDDRQSYIDSKQAYESSPESSLKDLAQTVEQVAEDELKTSTICFGLAEDELRTAAARLSLTSVN